MNKYIKVLTYNILVDFQKKFQVHETQSENVEYEITLI